jgi:hypothetical protein
VPAEVSLQEVARDVYEKLTLVLKLGAVLSTKRFIAQPTSERGLLVWMRLVVSETSLFCQILSHVLTDVDEDVLRVNTTDYNRAWGS